MTTVRFLITTLIFLQCYMQAAYSAAVAHQRDTSGDVKVDGSTRKKRDTCMRDVMMDTICERCAEFVSSVSHDQCCESHGLYERCISTLAELDSVENLLPNEIFDDEENSSDENLNLLNYNNQKRNLDDMNDITDKTSHDIYNQKYSNNKFNGNWKWNPHSLDLYKKSVVDDLDLLLARPDSNQGSKIGYDKRGDRWALKPHSGESNYYPDYNWYKRGSSSGQDYRGNGGSYEALMSKRGGHGLSGSYNRVWWRQPQKRPDENRVFRNFNRIWWKNGGKK